MHSQALWRRLDTPGHDAARVRQTADGWRLDGHAVFKGDNGPVSLSYRLKFDPNWVTRAGKVKGVIGPEAVDWRIERRTDDWHIDDEACGFSDLLDLDFGFTPATNLGQIQRLALSIGEEANLSVLWFDPETETLKRLPQFYRRVGEHTYNYRSPDGDYAAILELLPNGFVRTYPGLWEAET